MSTTELEYRKLVEALADGVDVVSGLIFGRPCLKVGGKAFLAYHQNDETIAFKLTGEDHARALALPGAALSDPSGKGRPMKAWVTVPASGKEAYPELARAALEFVSRGV